MGFTTSLITSIRNSGGALGPLTQPINLYQGSFDAQWEIDLWGKFAVRLKLKRSESRY